MVKVGSRRFGLVIDDILTTEEIVVKPMHTAVKRLACFSARDHTGRRPRCTHPQRRGPRAHADVCFDLGEEAGTSLGLNRQQESQAVLLFRHGPSEQFAAPLSLIRRVERVRMDQVERIGDREFLSGRRPDRCAAA